jgi:type IV secretion system protein VirB6
MYSKFRKYAQIFLIFGLCLFNPMISSVRADDTSSVLKDFIQLVVDQLLGATCYSRNIGTLLFNQDSHSCTYEDVPSDIIANIISPGLFANTMNKLKINDDKLQANGEPLSKQCKKHNSLINNEIHSSRTSYYNSTISFGICNDLKLNLVLAAKKALGIEGVVLEAIIRAGIKEFTTGSVSNSDLWDILKSSLGLDPTEYTDIYTNQTVGTSKFTVDIFPVMFSIIRYKDKVCVSVPSILGSNIPVGCVYVQEPYPNSIYREFFGRLKVVQDNDPNSDLDFTPDLTKCAGMGSCYQDAKNNSKTLLTISSPLIECIKRMLVKLLISDKVCRFNKNGVAIDQDSALYKFQSGMRKAVMAFLTIYIIIFGFRIILQGNSLKPADFIMTGLKFLLVVYFSIGINDASSSSGKQVFSGMIDWAFPIMFNAADALAGWVISSDPSGLCDFSKAIYEDGYSYIRLWDSLDCRVSNYLGLNSIFDFFAESGKDNYTFSFPPYLILLVPAILTGNVLIAMIAISYPLLIISVGAYMVNAFIVCMISITILGMLSPIFVPMALFNYTRGYFDAWLKLTISFVLQPIVVAAFMTFMFSVYESTFYESCKYITYYVSNDDNGTISTSDLGNSKRLFFAIDTDEVNYKEEDFKKCKNSLGFIFNRQASSAVNLTNDIKSAYDKYNSQDSENGNLFEGSITHKKGMFSDDSTGMSIGSLKEFLLSALTCCLILVIMYYFSAQLSEFAADVSSSIPLKDMGIKPQTLFNKGMEAIAELATSSAGGGSNEVPRASGPNLSIDTISAKGPGFSKDTISGKNENLSKDTIAKEGGSEYSRDKILGSHSLKDKKGLNNLDDIKNSDDPNKKIEDVKRDLINGESDKK